MRHRYLRLIQCLLPLMFGIACVPTPDAASAAQDATSKSQAQRPRIGLVLSGGGARGFAHIGVLRELEEARVPVDIVVGTSMGAIIGGLYAMGLSPDEIEDGVRGIDWNRVFDDDALREHRMYKRKLDEYDFFDIRRLGIKDRRLQVPPGLIEGQSIEIALDRLAHPAFHITDFNHLRLPYRAIATDIATGEAVIIDSGNLAKAMRASMSIPGALPPVRYGDKLLVDGGIGNNVPVNIARDMGADILIVVDVSDPLRKTEDIESGIDITGQLTTLLTRRVADQQLQTLNENDLLITPQRFDLSSTYFASYPELIAAGEDAAGKHLAELAELSISEDRYREYREARKKDLLIEPVIDFIEIRNNTPLADATYTRILRQQPGEALDVRQLEEDIAVIYGMDLSSSVVYNIIRRDRKTGLVVHVRYRDWAPSYVRFGLSLQTQFDAFSTTNLHASYTDPTINERAGEFRATARIGTEPGGSLEIYQPLDTDLSWFLSAKAVADSRIYPEVNNENLDAYFREQRQSLFLSGGRIFGTRSEIRLGLFRSTGTAKTTIGTSPQPKNDFDEGGYLVRYDRDSFDNISFPNSGGAQSLAFRANRRSFGSNADYEQAVLKLSAATTWRRSTLYGKLTLETTLDDNAPDNALFRHGGFLDVSGTTFNELSGQHFGVVVAGIYQRLGNVSFLPMYAGLSLEAGNAWDKTSDVSAQNTILAGSIFVGADTIIGPIYLATGLNDRSDLAVYLIIGKRLGMF